MKTKKTVIYSILIIVGILIFANILSERFFVRLDFTEDSRYTLSDATIDLLEDLSEPVTVVAYFSEDLPPHIAKTKKDFKELLIEYANRSNDMVVFKFINPNENEENEKEAMQQGIGPVLVNVREKDQVKQQKAFLGAVIQLGEQKEVIPFMQPGTAMEYALSSSIKKLSVIDKPTIGILQGHGEPFQNNLKQVNAGLSVLYNIEDVYLTDSTGIDNSKYKTIAIVAPKDSFSITHLNALDDYLAQGGNLFIALNRVEGNFQTVSGNAINTGLESWLESKKITVSEDFVLDANCGTVTVNQQQGYFSFQSQVQFPYLPVVNSFTDHPAVKGLESVVFQFASSINFNGDTSKVRYTPLLTSSTKSGTKTAPVYFDIQKQWTERDFPMSNVVMGALFEGNLSGTSNSRIILISDGDFAINAEEQRGQQLNPDNVNLMVNSIDYLSDDTGLISLRTRGVSSRPIDELEDTTKLMLKYLNFLLPILLVIVYGLFRMQLNRNKRIKRMEESYV